MIDDNKNINNFFNTLSVLTYISKSASDVNNKHNELILLKEEKLELLLLKFLRDSKKEVLGKLSQLDKFVTKEFLKNNLSLLNNVPLEPRQKFTQVGNTRFKECKFSVEIRDWIQKSDIGDTIDSITYINPDPFKAAIFGAQMDLYTDGGQSVFNIFDLGIDFALRDKNVEKFYENYAIKLSESVSKELQSNIKYEILEGIKTAESIPDIKNRILNVYKKPVDVIVKPKLDVDGNVLRQGYTYQMSFDHWATTTARTEVMTAYNAGRLQGFKDVGVVAAVEYSVSPDERLCAICSPFEGRIYKLKNADEIIPQHPNCRCQWIPVLEKGTFNDIQKKALNNVQDAYNIKTIDMIYKDYSGISFKGIDKFDDEFLDSIYNSLNSLSDIIGKKSVNKIFTNFGTFSDFENIFLKKIKTEYKNKAYGMHSFEKGVWFNDMKFFGKNKINKTLKSLKKDVSLGWHPKGTNTLASEIHHELFHQLDSTLLTSGKQLAEYDEVISFIREEILSDSFRKGGVWVGENVSLYAKEKSKEFLAELWSQYMIAPNSMTKEAKAIAERLEKLIVSVIDEYY